MISARAIVLVTVFLAAGFTGIASGANSAGDGPGAKKFYEAVVKAQPKNANAHYDLANAYLVEGRYAEALEHYEEANRLGLAASRMGNYYFNASVCCSKIGKIDEAIGYIEACLEVDPDHSGARALLAIYKSKKAGNGTPIGQQT